MNVSRALLLFLSVSVTACTFDGSAPEESSVGDEVENPDVNPESDPDPDPNPDPDPDPEPDPSPLQLKSTGEDTRKGQRIVGTFLNTQAADDDFEILATEKRGGDREDLEQLWIIDSVPAGNYRLEIVGAGIGPFTDENFRVAIVQTGNQTELGGFPSTRQLVSYEADVRVSAGPVVVQLRDPRDARIVEWEKGEFEPLFAELEVSRVIKIDSVTLTKR